jgi:hypothetical protein
VVGAPSPGAGAQAGSNASKTETVISACAA